MPPTKPTSALKNERQTVSYLMRRFAEVGIRPKTKYGQNFLVDLNLLELLADSADVGLRDVVLEVGTGTASLTERLAARAAHVVTCEVDTQMYILASEYLGDRDDVTILRSDILKNKNRLNPEVLDVVRARRAEHPLGKFRLAANLPYNVATPIISNLLLTGDLVPASMTVTIQKELANRMLASPRTKDYNSLSVWMQSQCDIEIVRVMPPSVFWPRPKVHSAILSIVPNPRKTARIPDLKYFHSFVRAMFFHRRKFLRSELLSAFKNQLGKAEVDEIMAATGLGPKARAEELEVETMLALCENTRVRAAEMRL
jgi:16S rRNA (adenine1518-N6/adenine1519-N6)-dimethyltransferase